MSAEEEKKEGETPAPEATEEMPKASEPGSWWTAKRKGVAAGIAAVAVVACIGVGAAVASQQPEAAEEPQQESAVASNNVAERAVEFGISAENWTDDSSPMIVHVSGTDGDGSAVDAHHAFTASGDRSMALKDGDYTVEWVSAINADGSIYKVPEVAGLKVGSETAKVECSFELIPADQVTADDLNAVIDAATTAVERGDATLSGEAGKTAIDKVIANASANPNANKEQVEAKAEVADATASAKAEGKDASAAKQEAQQKAPASVTQTSSSQAVSGGGSSSGSTAGGSSSGGSSAPAHEHSWVAVTTTVHHDAQYKTVHHDAVYKAVLVCKDCGAYNPSASHIEEHVLTDDNAKGGTVGKYILVSAAYDEQVLVSAAYDETVTTGYRCSGCGATK